MRLKELIQVGGLGMRVVVIRVERFVPWKTTGGASPLDQ